MFESIGLALMEKMLHELGELRRRLDTLIDKDTTMAADVTQFQADLDEVQADVTELGSAIGDLAASIGNIPSRIATAIQAAKDAQAASDQAGLTAAMNELTAIAATAKAASAAAAAAKTAADAIEVPTPSPVVATVKLVGPDGTAATVPVAVGGTAQVTGTSSDGTPVSYASDDQTVATVDASGFVTGVAAGSTAIEASNATGTKVSLGITVS